MKTFTFDQDEFPVPSSEETLKIWLASRSLYVRDIHAFTKRIFPTVESLPAPMAAKAMESWQIKEAGGCAAISVHLAWAGIVAPPDCTWDVFVIHDAGDELQMVCDAREKFIGYHWTMDA